MTSLQWLNIASCAARRLSALRLRGSSTTEAKVGEKATLDMALSKANMAIMARLRAHFTSNSPSQR
jgi:hypothetical protein